MVLENKKEELSGVMAAIAKSVVVTKPPPLFSHATINVRIRSCSAVTGGALIDDWVRPLIQKRVGGPRLRRLTHVISPFYLSLPYCVNRMMAKNH